MSRKVQQDKIVTIGGARSTANIISESSHTSGPLNLIDESRLNARLQYIPGSIPDISTAGSFFVPVPDGTVEVIYLTIDNAITVADAGISFEIDGTAITGGSITIPYATAAAGDLFSVVPTAANDTTGVNVIEMITDGASTTSAKAMILFGIKETQA